MSPALLAVTELDWITVVPAAGITGAGGFLAFRLLATVSDFTSKRYRESADYEVGRVKHLEAIVAARDATIATRDATIRERTAALAAKSQEKHDWKNFATSMIQEGPTIRRLAQVNGCSEIVELMDDLDRFRREHPLMQTADDLRSRDPDYDTGEQP